LHRGIGGGFDEFLVGRPWVLSWASRERGLGALDVVSSFRAAKGLSGEWIAYNYNPDDNRSIDLYPMPRAGLTVISVKSRWSRQGHVLDVHGRDIDPKERVRDHAGYLTIDPVRPRRATRTIFYEVWQCAWNSWRSSAKS
jgi:hypothetical protein